MSVSPRSRPGASSDLAASGLTIPSDSENYDANNESSASSAPPSSSNSAPMILYQPPTVWGLVRGAAINLLLPFINGLMLGFGELFANELAWRWGWGGTKVFPSWRSGVRPVGPGVEMRQSPVGRRRQSGEEMDMYTSLE
ncbi:uncharacterized protein PV09_02247 [Verruconis gallopava]|uniref:Mitochondrial import protein 1 n=1 Tax=Verruconis gallopava TaxID=253628 RepID=A0A0D2B856_9PEZI|nr:uncharacterized protein PV09_02247 [Verruconis gallopava]KIW07404.1 hypothetical protein PV09_02247 [Verruconis gallopava]